jgi:hypothetical protein
MSATTTTAKIPSDAWVVEVLADGTERPFRDPSMRIMTEAEIEAPADAHSDARPLAEEPRKASRLTPLRLGVSPHLRWQLHGACSTT